MCAPETWYPIDSDAHTQTTQNISCFVADSKQPHLSRVIHHATSTKKHKTHQQPQRFAPTAAAGCFGICEGRRWRAARLAAAVAAPASPTATAPTTPRNDVTRERDMARRMPTQKTHPQLHQQVRASRDEPANYLPGHRRRRSGEHRTWIPRGRCQRRPRWRSSVAARTPVPQECE